MSTVFTRFFDIFFGGSNVKVNSAFLAKSGNWLKKGIFADVTFAKFHYVPFPTLKLA